MKNTSNNRTAYQQGKERTRAAAIEWQLNQSPKSWGECAEMSNKLEKLGKRYGLIKELKREGVL